MLYASDWIADQSSREHALQSINADSLGVIAILASIVGRQVELLSPNAELFANLSQGLAELPPQFGGLSDDDAFGRWMRVAALAEHWGAPRLALIIVNALADLLRARVAGDAASPRVQDVRERIGMCWARRGRIARLAGELADAALCYQSALDIVRKSPSVNARPQALVGRSLLAQMRGNFPEGARLASQLIRNQHSTLPMYRIQAHQLLSITDRRAGRHHDAMTHGWSAFDLLERDDFRTWELIVSMSEIAVELGDLTAARHGFSLVANSHAKPRIKVVALIGWMTAAIKSDTARRAETLLEIRSLSERLSTESAGGLAPNDEASAQIAIAEAEMYLSECAAANARLDRASELAERHGFHEKQFYIAGLRDSIKNATRDALVDSASAQQSVTTPTTWTHATPEFRHPALRRLVTAVLA